MDLNSLMIWFDSIRILDPSNATKRSTEQMKHDTICHKKKISKEEWMESIPSAQTPAASIIVVAVINSLMCFLILCDQRRWGVLVLKDWLTLFRSQTQDPKDWITSVLIALGLPLCRQLNIQSCVNELSPWQIEIWCIKYWIELVVLQLSKSDHKGITAHIEDALQLYLFQHIKPDV